MKLSRSPVILDKIMNSYLFGNSMTHSKMFIFSSSLFAFNSRPMSQVRWWMFARACVSLRLPKMIAKFARRSSSQCKYIAVGVGKESYEWSVVTQIYFVNTPSVQTTNCFYNLFLYSSSLLRHSFCLRHHVMIKVIQLNEIMSMIVENLSKKWYDF